MRAISRRAALAGSTALLLTRANPLSAAPFEWRKAAPADAGFAPDIVARLDKLVTDKRAWGNPLGRVAFGADTLHDLRSVTKSILGLLYGIARAQDKVPPPERPLAQAFPEYAALATDPRAKRLTVANALTMTLGFDWNEDIPYQDPANSEIQMEAAPDRYRYIFTRPFIADPGTRWIYGAAGTALIGKLLTQGTGQSLPDFARANLFDPLGIGKTVWTNGFNGEPAPASGLRMTPRDLARIGQLILNRGEWDGRRIVPAAWLDASFAPHVSADEQRRYGYFWYVGDLQYGKPPNRPLAHWIGAFGYGGQRLFVLPGLDIVIAITAGNYADENQWMPPIRVVREVVLASLS